MHIRLLVLILFVSFYSPSIACADLVVSSIAEKIWDRAANPDQSPVITLAVRADANANVPNELNAFNIGLRIIPGTLASGSVEINAVSVPVNDAVFPAYGPEPFITFPLLDVPTVNGINEAFQNAQVTTSLSFFSFTLSSPSNDAIGVFDIYVVPEFTSYYTTTEFEGFQFENVKSGADVYLGSIRVSAVPEPMGLGTLAAVYAGLIYRRNKKHRKVRSAEYVACR